MSLDQYTVLVKQQELSRDAFLGGRVTIAQPERGFRAGLDSVLLGSAVSTRATSILDLGAGVGTASLVALADDDRRTSTMAEQDTDMAALAVLNLEANGFADRGRVLVVDVTAPGRVRSEAGLPAEHFSSVIANPPYFDPSAGSAPSAARKGARHMPEDALDRWVKTAATHAAPGGEVIFIHVAASLPTLLAAFGTRFGALTVLPLLPRPGDPASRVLVRGIKGSRAPFTLLAGRAMHLDAGRGFRPEFEAVFRGTGRLVW
jgi:tRNA1(Val) A37 N6-methylase TrmN6